ncbi:hypothetical protein [Streptomyces griseoaurantiacus]|uniref:hypothetical protein n=1 Tax=Streptomyces griseoaurantiacus TaxID=68213 RepID=UPI000B831B5C|nr:hypothetical protein [Streptomyces jietaisiensis]
MGAYTALDELCSHMPADSLIEMLLDRASERPAEVAECARRSYHHALGCEKIMLMVGSGSSTLRVHVWRPSDVPTHAAEHVHNHRFEFASAVLCGSMTMEVFSLDPSGGSMEAYAESIGEDGETWVMRPHGSERLRKTMHMRLAAGTLYQMDAGSLHRTANGSSVCTVTLFLEAWAGPGRPRTDVYSRVGAGAPSEFRRSPMRPDEYLVTLAGVRSLLATNGGAS